MAYKLLEILEILLNDWHIFAWVYGDQLGWRIQARIPRDVFIYEYVVEPGIVSPYRTAADVAKEIAEEVSGYGKS